MQDKEKACDVAAEIQCNLDELDRRYAQLLRKIDIGYITLIVIGLMIIFLIYIGG